GSSAMVSSGLSSTSLVGASTSSSGSAGSRLSSYQRLRAISSRSPLVSWISTLSSSSSIPTTRKDWPSSRFRYQLPGIGCASVGMSCLRSRLGRYQSEGGCRPDKRGASLTRRQPLGVLALLIAEGRLQRVVDVLQPDKVELLAGRGRDVVVVAPVAGRHQHRLDAGPGSGGGFLLDAADRQHLAAQAD